MSTSVRKEYAHFKDCKFNKVAIFNGIVLIQVACSSLQCTHSLDNAFMWTVSVNVGQKQTEARQTKEQRNTGKERTHHVTFLNLLIDFTFNFLYELWQELIEDNQKGSPRQKSTKSVSLGIDTPSKFLNTSKPFFPKFDLTVSSSKVFLLFDLSLAGNVFYLF